jgi:hypothetical protein
MIVMMMMNNNVHQKLSMHTSHDIKHKLLRFDSQRVQHKNAPHEGNRFVLVFYNTDINYKTKSPEWLKDRGDQRSLRLHREYHDREAEELPTKNADAERDALLQVLSTKKYKSLSKDNSTDGGNRKYDDNGGRFISFGVTASRELQKEREAKGIFSKFEKNKNNHIYFLLYKAVRDYINALAPVDNFFGMEHDSLYHACIISKNSQCVWHVDKNNLGDAVLTTLGDFTGGELLIESIQ